MQFSLLIAYVGFNTPVPSFEITGCIISPMIQLYLVFHMGVVQYTQGNDLCFSNMQLEVFPGITPLKVLCIAVGMTALYALILLYIWPYKIETDPERPLKWYYPFTCSFWRGLRVRGKKLQTSNDRLSPGTVNESLIDQNSR